MAPVPALVPLILYFPISLCFFSSRSLLVRSLFLHALPFLHPGRIWSADVNACCSSNIRRMSGRRVRNLTSIYRAMCLFIPVV